MTYASRFVRILLVAAIWALLSVGTASADGHDIKGEIPGPGEFNLLVTSRSLTLDQIISVLKQEGCAVKIMGVIEESQWKLYHLGVPSFVNEQFPTELAQGTPFYVKCLPQETVLRYECGGAYFVIESWDMPLELKSYSQRGEIKWRYSVPKDATQVGIVVSVKTSVGRIPPGTIQELVPDFALGRYGTLYSDLPGYPGISSPTERNNFTSWGFIDGKEHTSIQKVPLYSEARYNRGAPHHSLPSGWSYSDYSAPPFKIMEPPVIMGSFRIGDVVWIINTNKEDFCTSKPIVVDE